MLPGVGFELDKSDSRALILVPLGLEVSELGCGEKVGVIMARIRKVEWGSWWKSSYSTR